MLVNPIPYMPNITDRLDNEVHKLTVPLNKTTVLMDADSLVYLAGFAVEHGDEVEEFKKCEFILRNKKREIERLTQGANQHWYLTKGSTLWRNDYAEYVEYKGNRKNASKPYHYDECREFLVKKFGAKILSNVEADDVVADRARQYRGRVIICSMDKDLRTIAGHYINPNKIDDGIQYVTTREACLNLYVQMLMGDIADNIKGLKGWGIKKSTRALEGFRTEKGMQEFVTQQYKEAFPKIVEGWGGVEMTWEDILIETANLLFLREDEEEKFTWSI